MDQSWEIYRSGRGVRSPRLPRRDCCRRLATEIESGSLLETPYENAQIVKQMERRGHTDISSNSTQSFLDYTSLKQRISRLPHLQRARARGFRPGFQKRLHETQSVVAQKTHRQRYITWVAGLALRECVFPFQFPEVVEYIAAATGIEVAAVLACALYTENIGGWRRGVYDVVGETGVREWLWRSQSIV